MSDNPYQSPSAEVGVAATLRRSVGWKIYFFAISLIAFYGTFIYLSSEGAGFAEYLSLILLLIASVGLFGFCFLKKFLFPRFWLVFLVIYFVYGFVYIFITKVDVRLGMSDVMFYASFVFGLVVSMPGYYALYAYGNSDNPIWSKK